MFSSVSGRLTRETVPDIKDDDIFRAIADATLIYSNDRPRSLSQDVDGDGSSLYNVDERLDGWIDGFSVVHRIRYPLTSATIRPPTLDPDCYDIDRRPDGLYLAFYASRPGRSPFRVEYSTRHLSDLSTVPVTDQTAQQTSYYRSSSTRSRPRRPARSHRPSTAIRLTARISRGATGMRPRCIEIYTVNSLA